MIVINVIRNMLTTLVSINIRKQFIRELDIHVINAVTLLTGNRTFNHTLQGFMQVFNIHVIDAVTKLYVRTIFNSMLMKASNARPALILSFLNQMNMNKT